jgi:hypothetical protein
MADFKDACSTTAKVEHFLLSLLKDGQWQPGRASAEIKGAIVVGHW